MDPHDRIYAKVIEDSHTVWGDRLTTMEIMMHRFVLAEFNTHRCFSRNSASSRAIPLTKQLAMLREHGPAIPLRWPKEQPGMQGGADLNPGDQTEALYLWISAFEHTMGLLEQYVDKVPAEQRAHKSVMARLLEPFMWHQVVVSSTEWDNFFQQRCSPLAQPEIEAVAVKMRDALLASEPVKVCAGEWHTPYVTAEERAEFNQVDQLRLSVARCARVSYTIDGNWDVQGDFNRFDKLITADPPHWSPFEHVATPHPTPQPGNFDGWQQLRHSTTRHFLRPDRKAF